MISAFQRLRSFHKMSQNFVATVVNPDHQQNNEHYVAVPLPPQRATEEERDVAMRERAKTFERDF